MRKFTPKQNQEMRDMYNLRNESDKRTHTQKEVAEHFGTRNTYVSIINKINPETGEKFESRTEYDNYNARQKINPDTGEKFESRTEYKDYLARQRINPDTGEKFESLTEYNNYNTRQKNKNLEDRLGEQENDKQNTTPIRTSRYNF